MSSKTPEEARLNAYLLGEISEAERERLEEEYFADDGAFQQVLGVEDDLIDAYARRELSARERRRFEGTFLATARGRERVQFARALAGAVADTRAAAATLEQAPRPTRPTFFDALRTRGPALRFALIAASLAMAVGLTWLFVERARLREELRRLRTEHTALSEKAQEMERRAAAEQARSAHALAQLEAGRARPTSESGRHRDEVVAHQSSPRASRPPRRQSQKDGVVAARRAPGRGRESPLLNTADATVGSFDPRRIEQLPLESRNVPGILSLGRESFVLTPGLVRGGGANTLEVPDDATYIRLSLDLETESPHETYRAVIETADRRTIWRVDSFKPDRAAGGGAAVNLPPVLARHLPPGDYILTLSGRRPDDSFESVADYSFRVVRK